MQSWVEEEEKGKENLHLEHVMGLEGHFCSWRARSFFMKATQSDEKRQIICFQPHSAE